MVYATNFCLIFAVTACSSTNPYQRSKLVDDPVNQTIKSDASSQQNSMNPLAGNLDHALVIIKDQRREWYDSLSTQARVQADTQTGLLDLTTVALYSGLKAGVASDGDKNRLALAGAVNVTAYAGSDWFVNANQETAYIDGIQSPTCAMLAIEPLRVTLKQLWGDEN